MSRMMLSAPSEHILYIMVTIRWRPFGVDYDCIGLQPSYESMTVIIAIIGYIDCCLNSSASLTKRNSR